jgi:hypothetical protein
MAARRDLGPGGTLGCDDGYVTDEETMTSAVTALTKRSSLSTRQIKWRKSYRSIPRPVRLSRRVEWPP